MPGWSASPLEGGFAAKPPSRVTGVSRSRMAGVPAAYPVGSAQSWGRSSRSVLNPQPSGRGTATRTSIPHTASRS
jgi:hypothetical protein